MDCTAGIDCDAARVGNPLSINHAPIFNYYVRRITQNTKGVAS